MSTHPNTITQFITTCFVYLVSIAAVRAQTTPCRSDLPVTRVSDETFQMANTIFRNGVDSALIWCYFGETSSEDLGRIIWVSTGPLSYNGTHYVHDLAYKQTGDTVVKFFDDAILRDTLFRLINFYGPENIFKNDIDANKISRPYYYLEYNLGTRSYCCIVPGNALSVDSGDAAFFVKELLDMPDEGIFTQQRPYPETPYQIYFINGPAVKLNMINHFSLEAGACFSQILERSFLNYEITAVYQTSKDKLYGLSGEFNFFTYLVNTGINLTWLTDFNQSVYLVRPEAGMHVLGFDISYGYNLQLLKSNEAIMTFPPHQLSVTFRPAIWWNYIIASEM